MATKTIRKMVKIDEEKCNGCGVCLLACAEGALRLIDGKAKLISDTYCDGLGACLGECPQGAITIVEREAEDFNEEAVARHLRSEKTGKETPSSCPSATLTQFEKPTRAAEVTSTATESMLGHWPVQLALVPPPAPFLQDADVVLAADCVPFAYAGFHQDLLRDHALLVACPKLDNFQAHQQRLTEILRQSRVKSLTVVHMEVPCCSGLVHMARQAVLASGKEIPLREITIGINGNRKSG
ncbi:MAG: 4Fe-4S ferredoxin [Chloroflexi bacterium RBG_16_50_9]|nr:MAG: 4Fe-4S ferredoxin [Chloroflexi bacterium RBG_16_50_9]